VPAAVLQDRPVLAKRRAGLLHPMIAFFVRIVVFSVLTVRAINAEAAVGRKVVEAPEHMQAGTAGR
jgi:hypothetical protein